MARERLRTDIIPIERDFVGAHVGAVEPRDVLTSDGAFEDSGRGE